MRSIDISTATREDGDPSDVLLSVLVPALNESKTIDSVLRSLLEVPLDLEVILVDDGSTDGTWERMKEWADDRRIRAFRHTASLGKGAAVSTALRHARGAYVIIQDADMEYDPRDYPSLLEPLLRGRARAVFGTRMFSSHTAFSYWYVLGNRWVTTFANILYNVYLSDMQTAYKVFPRDAALAMDLESRGFAIDPEITAKLLRLGYRIHEVPVTYAARTRAEGKKVRAVDGLKALGTLLQYRRWRPRSSAITSSAARFTTAAEAGSERTAELEGNPQPASVAREQQRLAESDLSP